MQPILSCFGTLSSSAPKKHNAEHSLLNAVLRASLERFDDQNMEREALSSLSVSKRDLNSLIYCHDGAPVKNLLARHAYTSIILQVAYPLLTLLTCLEDDASFRRNIDTHTEQMNRQLRV